MTIRIPAEWERHACCWMAWAVHSEWGRDAARVKRELSEVILAIARYEPVRLLTPRRALREARRTFASCANVTVVEAPVDDIWMRDIAPTFAWRSKAGRQELVAIDWNFNGWGGTRERPPRGGDRLAKASIWGVPRIAASFVAEGGALITDGAGTLITTRSCLLNPNRNPARRHRDDRQHRIARELARFGVSLIIWLEGDPYEPVTSGHVDGYVIFAPGGRVLVEGAAAGQPLCRRHDINLLRKARNGRGRPLTVRQIGGHGFLNAYVANGAVIVARRGNRKDDAAAKAAFSRAFPQRTIVMTRIDCLYEGGGGIHCLTQPMPMPKGEIVK
jgi:agmatine deiminase